jgi:hypothetical protein
VGDIELNAAALELPGDGLTLIAHTAEPDSAAEEQLAILSSWTPQSTNTGSPRGSRPHQAR